MSDEIKITEEEAEKWLDKNGFKYHKYVIPAQGGFQQMEGMPSTYLPEREGWDVSGWAFYSDPKKCEERIAVGASTLVEAVEKIKPRWDAVMNWKPEPKKSE